MPKILLSKTLFADCEPEPFTVATFYAEIVCHARARDKFSLFFTQGRIDCRHLAGSLPKNSRKSLSFARLRYSLPREAGFRLRSGELKPEPRRGRAPANSETGPFKAETASFASHLKHQTRRVAAPAR